MTLQSSSWQPSVRTLAIALVIAGPGHATITEVREALDAAGVRIPITNPVRGQVLEFGSRGARP